MRQVNRSAMFQPPILEPLEQRLLLDGALPAPLLPDLLPGSDSGVSSTDDLTNVTASVVQIEGGVSGATVQVYRSGTYLGDAALVSGTMFQYTFSAGQLQEGTNVITARNYDGSALSPDSPALTVTLDSVAPFGLSGTGTYDTPGTARDVVVVDNLAYVADYDYGLRIIDISTPSSPTLVGTCNTPGYARGVAVVGNMAYVADDSSGLQIINVSTPSAPTLVGTCSMSGYAGGVAVVGNLAYVADYWTLQIINISTPSSPTLVGTYNTPGTAMDVAVAGDLAYVTAYSYGVQIINVSTPSSPTLVGTYDTPGFAYDIAIVGNLAYVADYGYGLQIINVSMPSSPTLVGTYDTPGFAYDVAIADNLAYVAEYDNGVQLIDVSAPASPTLLYTYDTPGAAYGVVLSGNLVYVADGASGLQVLGRSGPGLDLLASSDTGPISTDNITDDMTPTFSVYGGTPYVRIYRDGAQIGGDYDATPLTLAAQPFGTFAYTVRAVDAAGNPSDVSTPVTVTIAVLPPAPLLPDLVAADDSGISNTDDTTNAATPTIRIEAANPALPMKIYRSGVYLGDATLISGTTFEYVFTPGQLVEGRNVITARSVNGVVPSNDSPSLTITLDTTRPTTPTLDLTTASDTGPINTDNITGDTTPTFSLSGATYARIYRDGVRLNGDYDPTPVTLTTQPYGVFAYTAEGVDAAGNVSDLSAALSVTIAIFPSAPLLPDLVAADDSGVSNTDNITNVTTATIRIEATDAALPMKIYRSGVYLGDATLISGTAFEYTFAAGQLVEGSNVITARSIDGVVPSNDSPSLTIALDTTPLPPASSVGSCDTPGYAYDVAVAGRLALVADGVSGLRILDISNPALPSPIGSYDTSGYAYGVEVVGTLAFVADGASGLLILDISNPSSPTQVGSYDTSGNAYAVEVVGTLALVADGASGLLILDVSTPSAPTVVGTYDTPGYAYEVAVVGNLAYLADYYTLQIVNVSTLSAPVFVGSYAPGDAYGVEVVGNLAYMADNGYGLRILDVSTPTAPTLVGGYHTPGYAYDVAVVGNLAYVADYYSGLQIIDVSTPSAPTLAGSYNTSGTPEAVTVAGGLAFVADGNYGLRIVHYGAPVIDLAAASDTGPINTDNIADDTTPTFDVYGGTPYVRICRDGVQVSGDYDAPPVTLAVQPYGTFAYTAQAVDAAGNLGPLSDSLSVTITAFPSAPLQADLLAADDSGVSSTDDITKVTTPTIRIEATDAALPMKIYRSGTYLGDATLISEMTFDYVFTAGQLVEGTNVITARSIDGVVPSNDSPSLTITLDTMAPGVPTLDLVDSSDTGPINTDDITDDTTPTFNLSGATHARIYCDGVQVSGDCDAVPVTLAAEPYGTFAYTTQAVDAAGNVSGPSAALTVTIVAFPSAPLQPDLLAADDSGVSNTDNITNVTTATIRIEATDAALPMKICRSGVYLGDAAFISGTTFLYTFTAGQLQEGANVITARSIDGVVPSNDSPSLTITLDTTPLPPASSVGSYDTPGYAYDVAVAGALAFVADEYYGLRIIDISNPSSPSYVGYYDTPGYAYGLDVVGAFAYVADGSSGLRIFNVATPASPTLLGTWNTPGTAYDVAVVGTLAYVADYSYGLRIINVSSPSSPSQVGYYDTPGYAYGVAVVGNLVYVADGSYGLQIIDVSTPSSPSLVGTYNTPGYARGVAVVGNVAYVADDSSGLQIINVSTPSSPTLTGTYYSGYSYGVAVVGNLAYVADSNSGLHIVNVSTPSAPMLAGSYDTPGTARAVTVAGGLAFVADDYYGLRIIHHGAPVLDLTTTSDTGASGTDNITDDTTPTFGVFGGTPYVQIYRDGVQIGGDYDTEPVTLTVQPLGTFAYTTRAVDAAGNPGPLSDPLTVTIGVFPAAPTQPDLTESSDGGYSGTDNLTNIATATVRVDAADASLPVKIYRSGAYLGDATLISGTTFEYTFAAGQLQEGANVITARRHDGLVPSPDSPSLTITLDTITPAAPTLDLAASSDTGPVNTDNITDDTTPTFSLSGVLYYARVYRDGVQVSGDYETSTVTLFVQPCGTFACTARGVDAAGNVSDISAPLTITIALFPSAPLQPDLLAAGDSGVSNTDNTTNVTTPTIRIEATDAALPMRIYRSGAYLGDATLISGTTFEYTLAAGQLQEGTNVITARSVDGVVPSVDSPSLTITLDTIAPAMPTLDLTDASDTGPISSDNITDDTTPTFSLSGGATYARIYRDGVRLNGDYDTAPVMLTAQPHGVFAYTAEGVDAAGNPSTLSAPLSVTIAVFPSAPLAPDVVAGDDSGVSNTDNITNVTTPTIRVEATDAALPMKIYRSGAYLGDATLISGTTFEYVFTAGQLVEGNNVITARSINGLVPSNDSPSLTITLDTIPSLPASSVGNYDTSGNSRDVAVAGPLAFVADDYYGLRIVDISDPVSPIPVGYYDTPTDAYGVVVVGTLAYVADEYYGLRIIDISNPSSPAEVGFYDTTGYAYGVDVVGALAYLAVGSYGLQIFNVATPTSPTLLGTCNTPGTVYDVDVVGTLAYVADYTYGLQIIDVSTPSAPMLVGTYNTPGNAYGVAVAGNLAYVADDSAGLQIINVATPSAPTLAGSYDTVGSAYGLAVVGNLAYVADGSYGLQIIDVSMPSAPTLASFCDTPGTARAVTVAGAFAFVADDFYGLRVIHYGAPILDLAAASDTGPISTDNITDDTTPTFSVCGGTPYIRICRDGAQVSGDYSAAPLTLAAQSHGTFAYTARGVDEAGNLSDVSAPLTVTIALFPSAPQAPDLVPASDSGMSNTDNITRVTTPTIRIEATDAALPMRIYRSGAYLGDATLISGPTFRYTLAAGQLQEGTNVITARSLDGVVPSNDSSSLTITLDTTRPTTPTLDLTTASDTGPINTDNTTDDTTPTFSLSGGASYARVYRDGVRLNVDYDPPPVTLTTQPYGVFSYTAEGMDAAGNVSDLSGPLVVTIAVFPSVPLVPDLLAADDSGVSNTDNITNVATPTIRIEATNPALPMKIYRSGAYLGDATLISGTTFEYVFTAGQLVEGNNVITARSIDGVVPSDDSPSLTIRLDTTAVPPLPRIVGAYNTLDTAQDVQVVGNLAYVADGYSGLQIIDVSLSRSPRLVGALDTPGFAQGIDVVGSLAYVADADYGLRVVNVASPSLPVLVGYILPPFFDVHALDVKVVGTLAYVAAGPGGLWVVDVSVPSAPATEGGLNWIGTILSVDVAGTRAYVVREGDGVGIIDVSVPAHPTVIGSFGSSGSRDVQVVGSLAYAADWNGLHIFDVSTPSAPVLVGGLSIPGQASGVTVSGTRAYVAAAYSGLLVVDVSNPSSPAVASWCDTPDSAHRAVIAGDLAYVADGGSGLQVLHCGPVAPDLLDSSDTGASNVDNITDDTTPTFDVLAGDAYVRICRDGVQLNGDWDLLPVTLPVQPYGTFSFTARLMDVAGNLSGPTAPLTVTFAVFPPAPLAPDLLDAGDSGVSHTDNVTYVTMPTIRIEATDAALPMKIYRSGTYLGDATLISGTTFEYVFTAGQLQEGQNVITARSIDGIVPSNSSPTLSILLDTTPPTAPTLDLVASSDGGAFNNDNITDDTTPTFSVLTSETSPWLFWIYRDGAGLAQFASTPLTLEEQAYGTFNFTARVVDAAGNFSASSVSLPVTIVVLPAAPLPPDLLAAGDSGVSDTDNITNRATPTVQVEASANGLQIGIYRGGTHLGDATLVSGTTYSYAFTPGQLVEGQNVIRSRSFDGVNYSADSAALTITLDTTAPFLPYTMGGYAVTNDAYAVEVVGTVAYLADGYYSFRILDISNPLAPRLLATVQTPDYVRDVAVVGDLAYLALDDAGMGIINVADPFNPLWVGSFNTPDTAYGIAVVGNMAYVADDGKGLQIIDVTVPSSPVLAGAYDTSGYSEGVWVEGGFAYVADSSTLQIINVSNPWAPTLAASYDTPYWVTGITGSGNRVFLADNFYDKMEIVDVSNPSSPVLVSTYSAGGSVYGIAVAGTRAYLAMSLDGLEIVDIAAPSLPTFAGRCNIPGIAQSVVVIGSVAYVAADSSGLQIIGIDPPTIDLVAASDTGIYSDDNLTDDTTPAFQVLGADAYVRIYRNDVLISGLWETQPITLSTQAWGTFDFSAETVDAAGNVSRRSSPLGVTFTVLPPTPASPDLLAADDSGVSSTDNITNVTAPTIEVDAGTVGASVSIRRGGVYLGDATWVSGTTYHYAFTGGQLLEGNNLITARTYDGSNYSADSPALTIQLDTTPPIVPNIIGTWNTPGTAYDVEVVGTLAYVADYDKGLIIIDVSTPSVPTLVGSCDTPGDAYEVAIVGNLAYVADGSSGGLRIIDVSTPSSPTLVGFYDTPGYAYGVAVVGNLAYIADGYSGLTIIDVTVPSAPALVGTYDTSNSAQAVVIVSSFAYLAAGYGGLLIIDVSTPSSPTLVGVLDTPGSAEDLEVVGNLAYVADGYSGLIVINISSPRNPTAVGSYNTSGDATDVDIEGMLAYVADGYSGGPQVLSVANPQSVMFVGSCNTPGMAYGLSVVGNLAFVADGSSGLQVVSFGPPALDLTTASDTGASSSDNITGVRTPAFDLLGDEQYLRVYRDGVLASGLYDASPATLPEQSLGTLVFTGAAMDAAGNMGNLSAALSVTIVDMPPVPSRPDLLAADDSGLFDTDNVTNVITPTIEIDGLVPGVTMSIFRSGVRLGDATPVSGTVFSYTFAAGQLAEGSNVITARTGLDGVYLTADSTSLTINLDTTAPISLYRVGSYVSLLEDPNHVQVVGNLAFVADGYSGLRIIDVSTPASPTLVGSYDTPGYARQVKVVGTLAYVADGNGGLHIIDVSTPASPTWVGSWATWNAYFADVEIVGSLAYLADGYSGYVVAIDVSTPSAPTLLASLYIPEMFGVYDVEVSGSLAYVVGGDYWYYPSYRRTDLAIIDISTPSSPTLLGRLISQDPFQAPFEAQGVVVDGALAYVVYLSGGLGIIDVSDPALPVRVGLYGLAFGGRGIELVGSRAYVAGGSSGLQVIDVSTPSAPIVVGSFNTPGDARGLTVVGNLVYVADGPGGLQIIDVSTPASPAQAGAYEALAGQDVQIVGTLAYVSCTTSLRIFDVSSPELPMLVGTYNGLEAGYDVEIVGNLAYIGDGARGLRIIDVATSASPTLVGSYNTPGCAYEVKVVGTFAYVADGSSGLQIIDISTPSSPTWVGAYNTPGTAYAVEVVGTLAYVAGSGNGLQIINIATPSAPTLEGAYDTPDAAYDVDVAGTLAYVADYGSGLQIINIATPSAPTLAGSGPSAGYAQRVRVVGSRAYALGSEGVYVFDISMPALPVLIGSHYSTNRRGFDVAGTLTCVVGGVFEVLTFSPPTIDLMASSDTGLYDDDNVTWDSTPSFEVSSGSSYVRIYREGILVSDPYAGSLVTLPKQPQGTFDFTAMLVDAAGNVNMSEPSAPLAVALHDVTPPEVVEAVINDGAAHRSTITSIVLRFDEPVDVQVTDLAVLNRTTGSPFDLSGLAPEDFSYDPAALTATWDFSDLAFSDADYRATLSAAQVADPVDNHLADDYVLDFHVAKCDANGDRKIDGGDLALWQQYYDPLGLNPANCPGGGDWNGDGRINGSDLALWRQNYNPLGLQSVVEGTPVEVEASAGDDIVIDDPAGVVQLATDFVIDDPAGAVELYSDVVIGDPPGAVGLTSDPTLEPIGVLGSTNVSCQLLSPAEPVSGTAMKLDSIVLGGVTGIVEQAVEPVLLDINVEPIAEPVASSALDPDFAPAPAVLGVQLSPGPVLVQGSNRVRAYRPAIQPQPSEQSVQDILELAALNPPL